MLLYMQVPQLFDVKKMRFLTFEMKIYSVLYKSVVFVTTANAIRNCNTYLHVKTMPIFLDKSVENICNFFYRCLLLIFRNLFNGFICIYKIKL